MYGVQETDKATIDVEAQEDGILAKIIVRVFFNQY
jgi:pyruvate/2-oxoglutarate dehydrogenase complex dihydrolipoamide acyltransferase (E2) component